MCEPMTLMTAASIGISTANAIGGYMSDREYAKSSYRSLNQAYRENDAALLAQQDEITAQSMDDQSDVAVEALKRRAQVRNAASEAGLTGLVTDQLLQEVYYQQGQSQTRIGEMRRRQLTQNQRQRQAGYAQYAGQYRAVRRPNLLGTALQIGGGVAGAMAGQPPSKTPMNLRGELTSMRGLPEFKSRK
jgi:hypothetical protein